MENLQIDTQKKFFDYLIKRKGDHVVLNETMEVLNLRKGAVYKRMNGDTALTTAELVTLARYFDVSLDSIFTPKRYISFEHPFLVQPSIANFLDQFSFFLKPLRNKESSQLTYLANELPVFYYFSYKYVFNFLLSVWNHLHWAEGKLSIKENENISSHINYIRGEINSFYQGHPVTEIWNSNMLANLYQQIYFAITVRAFEDKAYLSHLIEDIGHLIQQLHDLASAGNNQEATERKIYLNDYGNYLNIVLYDSDKFKTTFIGYDIPQFLVSYNPHFHQFSTDWINKIKKRSVMMSNEGYQARELFFLKMENDYIIFKDRVEKLVAVYYF